ncbi:MAG TPA: right-handed parallel beta-helix repeat-containing protein, partial [Acidobacteriaceae bacterium]
PLALAALLFQPKPPTSAPPSGKPTRNVLARDIFADFRLPPVKDGAGDALWNSAGKLQMLVVARRLGLNSRSTSEAWSDAEKTFERAQATVETSSPMIPILFHGTRASELNALLAQPGDKSIKVTAAALWMDKPIEVHGRRVALDLGHTRFFVPANPAYLIRIENAQDVSVSGGVLEQGSWGVLVAASRNILLMDMALDGLAGGGVLVTGSEDVTVWHNTFRRLGEAAIILHGNTLHATVAENEMSSNRGYSNFDASVVLANRNADPTISPARLILPRDHGVPPQRIADRLTPPHDNIIAYNHIAGGRTSGIYSDGSVRNVIAGNRIEGNSKEGLCLDNGSVANVVAFNVLHGNGRRWGSDLQFKREFVFGLGRLPDRTSPAKLPAVSLDNAAYNAIVLNEIDGNFGGGVKMVRTAWYNLVGLNAITNNNLGANPKGHFFGIELGSAAADAPNPDLDFTPSRGDIVFDNIISGSHFAGVFFGEGSDTNTVFHNAIFGATAWAMESVRPQPNEIAGNPTDLKSRNIEPVP